MRWVEYESLFKGGGKSWESADFYGCALFFFSLSLSFIFFSFSLKHIQHHHPPFFTSLFSLIQLILPLILYMLCVYSTMSTEKKNFPHRRFCWCFTLSLSHFAVFISILLLLFSLCFCDSFFFRANHSPIFILSHSCTNNDHKKFACSFAAAVFVYRFHFILPEKIISFSPINLTTTNCER